MTIKTFIFPLLLLTSCCKPAPIQTLPPAPYIPTTYLPQELNRVYELRDTTSFILTDYYNEFTVEVAYCFTAEERRKENIKIFQDTWKLPKKQLLTVWYRKEADTLKVLDTCYYPEGAMF